MIRAAGAVVWRSRSTEPAGSPLEPASARVEIAVVHRPKYDDWSLPKGKAEPGETDEECAHREVREETGLGGDLGPWITASRYVDRHGHDKIVQWWAMEVTSGEFAANDEVDELRWLTPGAANRMLTYERDRNVVVRFSAVLDIPAGG